MVLDFTPQIALTNGSESFVWDPDRYQRMCAGNSYGWSYAGVHDGPTQEIFGITPGLGTFDISLVT